METTKIRQSTANHRNALKDSLKKTKALVIWKNQEKEKLERKNKNASHVIKMFGNPSNEDILRSTQQIDRMI